MHPSNLDMTGVAMRAPHWGCVPNGRAPPASWASPTVRTVTSTRHRLAGALVTFALFVAACGGDDTAAVDGQTSPTPTARVVVVTATPVPTNIAIPTATPGPTPLPPPTSTPIPLEAPTPSAILLNSAFTNSDRVTTVGIGDLFFGTTPERASEIVDTEWIGERSSTSNCYRILPTRGPEGVEFWVVDGFIERVDISHPDLRTPSQLGLGISLADLESQLGERLSADVDDAGNGQATFTPADESDANFRIVFELEDSTVVRYRSGRVGVINRSASDCFSSTTSTE